MAKVVPEYETVDSRGLPHVRPARCIGELATAEEREQALESATMGIASLLNSAAQRRIGLGTPVHVAFGLTRQQAKNHVNAKLLLLKGEAVSLAQCGCFTA